LFETGAFTGDETIRWFGLGTIDEGLLPREHPQAVPIAVAAAVIVGPLVVGFAVGWLLRATLSRGRSLQVAGLVVAVAPTGVVLLVHNALDRVGLWDLVSIGVFTGLGVLLGAARRDLRSVMVAVVSTLLSFGALEAGVRLLLPVPQRFPPIAQAALVFPHVANWGDVACAALYPSHYPAAADSSFRTRTAGARDRPLRVLHLGDSMVEGDGVQPQDAFPKVLERLEPDVAHINGGFGGTGPDFSLLLARRWLDRTPIDLVVLYPFNDLDDIDSTYACCPGGGLLAYESTRIVERCPQPVDEVSLGFAASHSPLPYWLRVATGYSFAARHLAVALGRFRRWHDINDGFVGNLSEYAMILETLRDELRARHIPLLVVGLPWRASLENARLQFMLDPLLDVSAGLDIPTLSATDFMSDVLRTRGSGALFLPNDTHFNESGHRLLAGWLEPQIRAALKAPKP